jgi:hypothetical protein
MFRETFHETRGVVSLVSVFFRGQQREERGQRAVEGTEVP